MIAGQLKLIAQIEDIVGAVKKTRIDQIKSLN